MYRIKLLGLLLVLFGTVAATAVILAGSAATQLLVDLEERVKSAAMAARLSDAVDDYSLITLSQAAASADGLAVAMGCPATDEALRAATREQTPAVNPVTGQPVLDALGRPLDTNNQPILAQTAPRCLQTQHGAVLDAMRTWTRTQDAARTENLSREVYNRTPGHAFPREPDLLIAADASGVVVARIGREMDSWFGPSRPNMNAFPTVALAELGSAQHGMITWREYEAAQPQLAQVGVSPVIVDGQFLGTITVGYFVVNEAAEEDRQMGYGVDFAYFFREANGATPTFGGTSFGSRPTFLAALSRAEYFLQKSDGTAETTATSFGDLTTNGIDKVYRFEADGFSYFATAVALASGDNQQDVRAGVVVIASATQMVGGVNTIAATVPVVAVIVLLIGLFGFTLLIREHLQPLQEVSRGIQEVIAGNKDFMWVVDPKSPFSDLSHALNVMSAQLQGKRDPDAEDEGGTEEWAGLVGGPAQAARPAAAGAVAGLGNLKGRRSQAADDGDGSSDPQS